MNGLFSLYLHPPRGLDILFFLRLIHTKIHPSDDLDHPRLMIVPLTVLLIKQRTRQMSDTPISKCVCQMIPMGLAHEDSNY